MDPPGPEMMEAKAVGYSVTEKQERERECEQECGREHETRPVKERESYSSSRQATHTLTLTHTHSLAHTHIIYRTSM